MVDSLKHNVLFVFTSNLIPSILTYGFWLIASNLTDSSMIGTIGSISSLAMILVAISSLDIPTGVKRFLGKTFSDGKDTEFGNFSYSSIVFILISSIVLLTITLNPWIGILDIIGLETKFIIIIIVIVISNNLQNTFRSILTSSLNSKSILIPSISSSVIRIVSLILFFFIFELSDIEIAWAYSIFYIGLAIGLFVISKKYIKIPNFEQFKSNIKLTIQSSLPKYFPTVIGVIGTHLSMIVIFSSKGASESGLYFIPYALFAVIVMLSGSINQITHPVWSGMKDDQEQSKLLEKNIHFTFLATIPLVVVIIILSTEIVTTFGSDFKDSGIILTILLISYPILIVNTAIFFLLHAKGYYKEVLYIGLFANIPRIILYFIMIPEFGSIGAAYAMVAGVFLQFIPTIIIARKLHIRIHYTKYVIMTTISYGLGTTMFLFESNIISAIIVFIGSYILYLKFKILDKQIIKELCKFSFSEDKGNEISTRIINGLHKMKLL